MPRSRARMKGSLGCLDMFWAPGLGPSEMNLGFAQCQDRSSGYIAKGGKGGKGGGKGRGGNKPTDDPDFVRWSKNMRLEGAGSGSDVCCRG